jgi:hypothetical protein
MAERLVPLLATKVARVQFPILARPTLEWKRWFFSVTLRQGAHSQALQLRL